MQVEKMTHAEFRGFLDRIHARREKARRAHAVMEHHDRRNRERDRAARDTAAEERPKLGVFIVGATLFVGFVLSISISLWLYFVRHEPLLDVLYGLAHSISFLATVSSTAVVVKYM